MQLCVTKLLQKAIVEQKEVGEIELKMHKPVWRSFAPLKCKIFSWLALRRRLWTSDRTIEDKDMGCRSAEACFS
jgi:predicted XRE-type DNA-binding protein